jgi:hypothetical protein
MLKVERILFTNGWDRPPHRHAKTGGAERVG